MTIIPDINDTDETRVDDAAETPVPSMLDGEVGTGTSPKTGRRIKPGLIVALATTVNGGVWYRRIELDAAGVAPEGGTGEVARWETARTIADPKEHRAADLLRASIGNKAAGLCCRTPFGLICPPENEDALLATMASKEAEVAVFNRDARFTRVTMSFLTGRVDALDEASWKAVAREVAVLVDEMEQAIREGSVSETRKAADKLNKMTGILEGDSAIRAQAAVDEARGIARKLVKAAGDAVATAAIVEREALNELRSARFAFLDMDDVAAVEAPTDEAPAEAPAEEPVEKPTEAVTEPVVEEPPIEPFPADVIEAAVDVATEVTTEVATEVRVAEVPAVVPPAVVVLPVARPRPARPIVADTGRFDALAARAAEMT